MVLERLVHDKIINKEIALEYSEKWQIIVIKNNWFKTWVKKFNISNPNQYIFKYVKFED
jgi:hypothetical protein